MHSQLLREPPVPTRPLEHMDYLPLERGSRLGVTRELGARAARALKNGPMTVTPPPGTPRRRFLKPYQRRALTLLAGCGSAGCQEAVMRAHGFTPDQLAELVRIG